jgi:hypothetical protein
MNNPIIFRKITALLMVFAHQLDGNSQNMQPENSILF